MCNKAVSIGNFADVNTGKNQDVVSVFGNSSTINTGEEDDLLRLMGHQSHLLAGLGNDFIWTDAQARHNTVEMGDGNDTVVLGGADNVYSGGEGVDTFIINDGIINVQINDISQQDQLVFADMSYEQIWFAKNNTDLVIHLDNERSSTLTVADYFNQANRADIVVSSFTEPEFGIRRIRNVPLKRVRVWVTTLKPAPNKRYAHGQSYRTLLSC